MNKSVVNTPIFVVAPVRSGSTLLHLMLGSHPEITNPGECDFIFDLVDDAGNYPDMKEYRNWLSLNRIFNAKQLKTDETLSYPDLMQFYLQQLIGTKALLTLNVHRNFHRIPGLFPAAKYIHLLRDPRDVARSCIGMGWAGHVYYGVDIWIDAERSWDQLKSTLDSSQYMEVRYEELIESTERTLTAICEFLGIDYSAHMMDYAEQSTYDLPNQRLTYQWKTKYSERELCLVEGKVGDMLIDRGYEPSGFSPDVADKYELLTLALENKLYRIKFSIKKYGFFLYAANVLSGGLGWLSLREYCQRKINQIDIEGLK